jgi:hypothetical protein
MFEETFSKYSLQSKMADFNRLSRKKDVNPRNQIVSLLVVALIAGSSFFLAKRVTQPVHVAEKSNAAAMNSVRIMNVYYIPVESPWVNKPQSLLDLKDSLKIYLAAGSQFHQDPTKQVVTFDEVVPAYTRLAKRTVVPDNDPYTEQLNNMKAILTDSSNGKNICDLVNEQNIDQVWLWADTDFDKAKQYEFTILNNSSNYGDRRMAEICGNRKSFVVMGFAMNSPIENAVHSFTHFLEILTKNLQGEDLFFGRYEGIKYNAQGEGPNFHSIAYPPYKLSESCGNIHTPPNIPLDPATNTYTAYDYANLTVVDNSCQNWRPDGTGVKTPISAKTWAQISIPAAPTVIRVDQKYYIWWMQNFNHESSGLLFNGKKIPTWWDFVSETDKKISTYMSNNYWMNPELKAPVTSSETAFCTNESGTYSSCTYTPGSTTLGASTENNNVLAATTYGDMALVTVSYGSATSTVLSVTFCGDAMTRVGTGPFSGAGTKNEMWYKLTPQSGVCPVTVKFSADPGQRVVSTTIFNNIDQVVPVTGFTTGGLASGFTANPGAITATLTGAKDSLMICGYAHYSEQSNPPSGNFATANTGTTQLWTFKQAKYSSGAPVNTWAGLGAGVQRLNPNQSTTLSWKTVKSQPNSYTCANFNVKPFATTVTTPTTTVDVKAQASNGPVTLPYKSSLTISWSSTLATSCTASGAWTGTKGISGSQVIAGVVASGTYTLTCNGVSDSVSVVVIPPKVDLKIGTSDGPFTVPYNGSFTLSWTAPGATSCTASGAWTGTKLASGSLLVGAVTANKTYTLTCNGGTDSINVVVSFPPTAPIVDIKADGLDRISGRGQFTTVLSWKTVGATSCKALGGWAGVKPINGSETVTIVVYPAKPVTKNFVLQCVNAAGSTWYDNVFVVVEPINTLLPVTSAKMFVNGFDDTLMATGSGVFGAGVQQKLYIAKGSTPTLTLSVVGLNCTAPWLTTPPDTKIPASYVMPAITSTTTYSMTCLDYKSVPRTVTVDANVR